MSDEGLQQARDKMAADDVDPMAIEVFSHYYRLVESGETGMIREADIEPLDMDALADVEVSDEDAVAALGRTVVVKLNGGLGTSMGLAAAKTLLEVRDGLTFLDVIARQVLALRERHDVRLPLLFMDSFRTRDDTLEALARYADLPDADLPLDFLQNKEPKLLAEDLTPVSWPDDPTLEWCPPGHGDLYTALRGTGLLDAMIEAGFTQVFVSNSDNLGAVPDPRVAGWFAASGAPFAIEAVRRTPSDRKGGHFARRTSDGRIVLRETAQTADEDKEALADLDRHRFTSTNNLWFDLAAMKQALDERDGILGLAMIRNTKTVDPSDSSTPEVDPDRDRDGRGHRGVRGRHHHRGRPRPVRAGEDDQRPAGAAQRLLPARRRRRARAGRRGDPVRRPRAGLQAGRAASRSASRSGVPSLREATRFEVAGRLDLRRRRHRGRRGRGRRRRAPPARSPTARGWTDAGVGSAG